MGMLRIHCEVCGKTWEVYARDDWKSDNARTCPHCFEEIDRQTWERSILPAFGAMQDANRELMKDYCGYHIQKYKVDYIEDYEVSAMTERNEL